MLRSVSIDICIYTCVYVYVHVYSCVDVGVGFWSRAKPESFRALEVGSKRLQG